MPQFYLSLPPSKHLSKPPTLTSEIEPQLPETDASVTLEEVQEHWQDIIEKIKDVNYPLANLIKHSTLQDVSQGRVVLGVKFLFHKQNLENKKNCLIFFKACEEALGKHIGLTAQVLKNGKSEDSSPEEVITDALKIFGGELVD